ncbi:MAG: hypothetical protein RR922_06265 [Clostridia bacterium]
MVKNKKINVKLLVCLSILAVFSTLVGVFAYPTGQLNFNVSVPAYAGQVATGIRTKQYTGEQRISNLRNNPYFDDLYVRIMYKSPYNGAESPATNWCLYSNGDYLTTTGSRLYGDTAQTPGNFYLQFKSRVNYIQATYTSGNWNLD